MAVIPGICGPANRPCKISHSSSYPNQVGIYPSEFLPSTFTIWHAVFASQFPLQNRELLLNPIGGGILPGIDIGGGFPGLTGPIVRNWQSHHYVIFAKTENRLNVAYTLTAEDITRINAVGTAEIDIGEYVFEVVSVTDEPVDFDLTLTPQEIEELESNEECTNGCSPESLEDRKFRKIFEQDIKNNRLIGIVVNEQGIEYRLDNGSQKAASGLSQAGIGDLNSASYRDGSSKKLEVNLMKFGPRGEPLQEKLEPGDVIYLSYVAVKEHYIRQRVNISWQTIDTGFVTECISLILGYSIVHYRFYEWDLEPEPGASPTRLAGWRAVESFSSDINFVAPVFGQFTGLGPPSVEEANTQIFLADFPVGAPENPGSVSYPVFPSKLTPTQLQSYMDGTSTSTISVNLNRVASQGAFHENLGANSNNTAFRNSEWFLRNQFTKYTNQKAASDHVFFNVHPRALKKRDIDKWGIERYLAEEVEKDIRSGKLTFFPFMDDPDVNNPTLGANTFLDSSNTKFEPILPVTSYGGNFEAVCASIGSFPANPADGINAYHSFESNRIVEKFDKETRLLVERNFAVNADVLGPQLITIEGVGGTSGSITCISDPSKEYQTACHINSDNFIVYNFFSSGHIENAIRSLSFRPDISAPSIKTNTDPHPNQFEPLIGFSGMIGDIPGIQPGRAISIASYAHPAIFRYTTTNKDKLQQNYSNVSDSQVDIIAVPPPNQSPLTIAVDSNYYGSITIEYILDQAALEKQEDAILAVFNGSSIGGMVDNIVIRKQSSNETHATLKINFKWLRATSFELRGDRVQYMTVKNIVVDSIDNEKVNDFLNEENSHSKSFADLSIDERKTDRSLFFSSDIISLSEDSHSNLYVFFNDKDRGISAAASNDYGGSWCYYFGVFEKIDNINAINPFAVTSFASDCCFLFFNFGGKILCKKIPFSLFQFIDANLIQRFSETLTISDTPDQLPVESNSIYSEPGKVLRRGIVSYVVAGDLTDSQFLEVAGKVPGEFKYEPFETRIVNGVEKTVRKNPVGIGASTTFTNHDILDPFFSAYRKNTGELRFWFMGITDQSDIPMLQCHFSADDGISWYDLWEYIEHSRNRLRVDSNKKTTFIDRSASGAKPASIEGVDPQEGNQSALFGINIHWSRLKRHKIGQGELTINSESEVLGISSPYVFYQSTTDRVFLFYIYEGCLLCKVFNDALFTGAVSRSDSDEFSGMTYIKKMIEQNTRSFFIDGSLTSEILLEEIHGFANDNTKEVMVEGNIVFKYPFAYNNFGDDRQVSAQRICALDLPTGLVRVFYKHQDSSYLKSALWTGSEWWAEDFLKSPSGIQTIEIPDTSSYTSVTGGFNGTGFNNG